MRYSSIRSMDISNGEGIGVALFVQGCPIHCKGCFNTSTWDFNGGKEWTEETKKKFLELVSKPYIHRVSILGGEPLAQENRYPVFDLINSIRNEFGTTKLIWLYSGYTYEEIYACREQYKSVVSCDVLVDGRYEHDKRDMNLKFRGSTNQRVINIKETVKNNKVVLYCD